jgi:fatty-acyl-CoA synthase
MNGRNIWPQDIEFLAEQHPEIRSRDAAAFSVPGIGGEDTVALVVQCRHFDEKERCRLVEVLRGRIKEEFGIDCIVELVPPHTLPQTSSGKISRTMARSDYLRRNQKISPTPLQIGEEKTADIPRKDIREHGQSRMFSVQPEVMQLRIAER